MSDNEILEKIVSLAVDYWNGNFSGISGLEIASRRITQRSDNEIHGRTGFTR